MNEDFLTAIQKAFGCQILGVKPRRNVLFLRTDRGNWVVKEYRDLQKAQWVTHMSQVLFGNGFTRTVSYQSSKDGELVFPYGDRFYTVMKEINGREAKYTSVYDVMQAARTLAHFHCAARGLPPFSQPLGCRPPLLEKWETRLADFIRITDRIHVRGPVNRLEAVIQHVARDVIQDAREVLDQSRHMPMITEMHRAMQEGTIAHRDVASHNFLLTPGNECYLIDLDTAYFDMQLVDLVQFLGRLMLMQEYRIGVFIEVLNTYSRVIPLNEHQIRMIYRLMRYPENILREVTGVYNRRPGYRARGALQLLQLERQYWRQRSHFLTAEHLVVGSGPFWQKSATI
ncbi:MAG: phosphotransferase [Brevibacillus sp.]|nr:phosphotransferase [Brevibacillus sp.]